MGKAIILDTSMFASANLGQVTPVDIIYISSISISGNSYAIKGFGSNTYSIVYSPQNTTQKGVTWEIVNTPEGISVASDGTVTVLNTTSVTSFTLKATSNYDASVYATKTISVISATIFSFSNLYNGNINTSSATSNSRQFCHYGNIIECQAGDVLHIKFPKKATNDYSAYYWRFKIVELNTTTLPDALWTTSNTDLTDYVSVNPSYVDVAWTEEGSDGTYMVTGSGTACAYFQFCMRDVSGGSDFNMTNSSSYGNVISGLTKQNWAVEYGNSEQLGYFYSE